MPAMIIPSLPDPVGPAASDAWAEVMRGSITSMQATARWMLGVVAAWWYFVPQLSGLRRLVPADLPPWATYVAAVALLLSGGLALWAVYRTQGGAGKPVEVRNLSPADLAYVQDWGHLTGVETSERWRARLAASQALYDAARYLPHTPIDRWQNVWRHPIPPVLPSYGEALCEADRLTMMRREERDAVLVLTYRDIRARFNLMRVLLGIAAVIAAAAIIVLVGPPASAIAPGG